MRETERLDPVMREVEVPASPEEAFRRFTAELERWWPLGSHSVSQSPDAGVRFPEEVGGEIVERAPDGSEHAWGTVTAWDPPRRVAFTWHPGRDPSTAQDVTVTFEPAAEGRTRVRVVHGGWERFGDGAAEAHAQYGPGWEYVLGKYAAA